ncbi:lymphocyte antigen 6D-like [Tamandua tetradactyla]|uniref:lymphocyte antigen 6D-like n=1 Tax=Tamandua tetradactyla TaxID=48850 RepID=UPI00405406E5
MRPHLLQLLLLLLLTWPVQALRCHECSASRNCHQATSCKAGTRYCLTTWTTSPDKQAVVIKSCAYTCPGFQESLFFSRASCCNTDLCNSATGRSTSWGLLALSMWVAYLNR